MHIAKLLVCEWVWELTSLLILLLFITLLCKNIHYQTLPEVFRKEKHLYCKNTLRILDQASLLRKKKIYLHRGNFSLLALSCRSPLSLFHLICFIPSDCCLVFYLVQFITREAYPKCTLILLSYLKVFYSGTIGSFLWRD